MLCGGAPNNLGTSLQGPTSCRFHTSPTSRLRTQLPKVDSRDTSRPSPPIALLLSSELAGTFLSGDQNQLQERREAVAGERLPDLGLGSE